MRYTLRKFNPDDVIENLMTHKGDKVSPEHMDEFKEIISKFDFDCLGVFSAYSIVQKCINTRIYLDEEPKIIFGLAYRSTGSLIFSFIIDDEIVYMSYYDMNEFSEKINEFIKIYRNETDKTGGCGEQIFQQPETLLEDDKPA